jgi:hypothetical protein
MAPRKTSFRPGAVLAAIRIADPLCAERWTLDFASAASARSLVRHARAADAATGGDLSLMPSPVEKRGA